MSDLVSVTLTGPAKIGGIRKPAGTTVSVSTMLALQLAASGVINPELAQSLSDAVSATPLEHDFQAVVDAAVAERLAVLETKAAEDLNAAHERIAELERQLSEKAKPEAAKTAKAAKATTTP
ncbi:hypothetical protein NAC44_01935 [Allorhizobium sp. BGMRC 0089]|uniref:hypothetical protein n=1 Tax=Allorhizobium sonneratiae TaxID=2934936 RepID=UPI002034413D|nr:hypothetical protein [Allorhizobium sonneratiae]MCM2291088.1 hypothetical protein [Allorhizobium sonneratiae]